MLITYSVILSSLSLIIILRFLIGKSKKNKRHVSEHILKYMINLEEQGIPSTIDSIRGGLGIAKSKVYRTLNNLREVGLIKIETADIKLTKNGRELAIEIVRAHRLWETYFGRETGVSLYKIHKMADKKEHDRRGDTLEALNAHLGFPVKDPHGDPIPSADGYWEVEDVLPLSKWPVDKWGIIAHVEDEPLDIGVKLLKMGFISGKPLKIISRKYGKLEIEYQSKIISLDYIETLNIQIRKKEVYREQVYDRLSDLNRGKSAIVASIDEGIQGLERRRLLDLGFTPGTKISNVLQSSFGGDPTAYSIRGSKVALRKEQAKNIYIMD